MTMPIPRRSPQRAIAGMYPVMIAALVLLVPVRTGAQDAQSTKSGEAVRSGDVTKGGETARSGGQGNVSPLSPGSPHQPPGDLNRDGAIDVYDLLRLREIALHRGNPPVAWESLSADVNSDGTVDLRDVDALASRFAGAKPEGAIPQQSAREFLDQPAPLDGLASECPDITFLQYDVGWTWVDPANPIRELTGRVNPTIELNPESEDVTKLSSFVTFTDFPIAHNSHDQNIHVTVDPEYRGLLSLINDLPDDTHPLLSPLCIPPPSQIEIEWETGIGTGETHGDGTAGRNGGPIFPKWAWANPGDRIWVVGHHIYDCGHGIRVGTNDNVAACFGQPCILTSVDCAALSPERFKSEIHPPIASAAMRNQLATLPGTGSTPVPVVATDLYIHGDGGWAPTVLAQHDVYDQGKYETTPIARDFEFDIHLRPKPTPDAVLQWTVSDGPYNTIDIAPILTPNLGDLADPRLHVYVPLARSGVKDLDTYGRHIVAGWAVPREGIRHLSIKLDRMVLVNDMECSLCGDGELSFFWLNVPQCSDEWQRLSDFEISTLEDFPALHPCPDHRNIMDDFDDSQDCGNGILEFSGPTFDVFVVDGDPVSIQARGYDQDCFDSQFGRHNFGDLALTGGCYLVASEVGDNDVYATFKYELEAPTYGTGKIGHGNRYPDNQYDLYFTVTELEPPAQPTHLDLAEGAPGGGDFELLVAGADLVLRRQGGPELFRRPKASVTRFTLNGSDGNDRLIVMGSGGNPIPPQGLVFNGAGDAGAPGDALVLQGGTFNSITYSFTNGHDGSIRLDPDGPGGVEPSVISFTGLEPITTDNLSAGNRVFDFTDGEETITLSRYSESSAGVSRVSSSAGEMVDFTNPTLALTVNAGAGAGPDVIDLHTLGADFNANVMVNASSDGDHITVEATTGTSNAWTINGGSGNEAIRVDFGRLARPVNVLGGGGSDSLVINGTAGGDAIASTASAVTRGSEVVIYASIADLTVDAKDGADVVTVNGTGPVTTVLGSSGDDDVFVNSAGPAGITLDGQAGSDDYTVQFGGLAGVVNLGDTPPANVSDRLFVIGTSSADALLIAPAFVRRNGTETVNYTGIEELTVDAGNGKDNITVAGASVPTKVFGGNGDDSMTASDVIVGPLMLDGGADNDVVDASALTSSVTIYGGTGNDLLVGGSNNDMVYGQAGDDDLIGNVGSDYLDGGDGSDGVLGDKGTIAREIVAGPASEISVPNEKLKAVINVPGTIRRNIALIDEGTGAQGGDEVLVGASGINNPHHIDIDDILVGGRGNDYLHGGAGNDKLAGDDGADELFGDAGNDELSGGAGGDHLYGGAGSDQLNGQTGTDIAYGGDGDDRLIADRSDDALIDWFGNSDDFVVPGPGQGSPTIVRSPSPWVRDFLLNLARAGGAVNPDAEIRIVIPGGGVQGSSSGGQ